MGSWKRRHDTGNIRAATEMRIEGKRSRGRPRLRYKDTVGREAQGGMGPRRNRKHSAIRATPDSGTAAKVEILPKKFKKILQQYYK